jgi:hypothetical protein
MSKTVRFAGSTMLFLVFLLQSPCFGADGESVTARGVLKFGGGIVSAFLIHEAAHAAVAAATGTGMNWRLGDINQPITFTEHSSSTAKGLAITSAGLIAQAIGAEVILQYDRIDKNDSYVRGMMLWNVLNPLLYAADYWFLKRTNSCHNGGYQGDLRGTEHYTSKGTADAFSATMAALALFQGYRFARTQTWAPDWLRGEQLDRVALTPLPSGGASLTYAFEF